MKSIYMMVAAAGLAIAAVPVQAEVLDLSTMTCKQFSRVAMTRSGWC